VVVQGLFAEALEELVKAAERGGREARREGREPGALADAARLAAPRLRAVGVSLSRILPRRGPAARRCACTTAARRSVDIWGGTRDAAGNPWQEDTLSISFSTTEGRRLDAAAHLSRTAA
jgi:hypothetical protein